MPAPQKTPQEWAKQIASSDLPSFGGTLEQVGAINEFIISHAAELTRVVLRDPGMTAKVIRLANSVHFNPTQRRINTVSRAVMVLGFKTIRSLCFASLLMDELLKGDASDGLRRELAGAFEASMQAREIALAHGDKNVEEIFIAAMLSRLGELAFWCKGGEAAEQLSQALRRGVPVDQAEEHVLGFRLKRLTQELVREWRISDTLSDLVLGDGATPAAQCVQLGVALAHCNDRTLQSELAQVLMQQIAAFTGQSLEEIAKHRADAQENATSMLKACGMMDLIPFITGVATAVPLADDSDEFVPGQGDPLLQLAILRELALMSQSKVDINLVLQLALEAIHRGAGIHRVAVALVNQTRTQLLGKYAVEWPATGLLGRFQFDLFRAPALQQVLNTGAVLWSWRDGDNFSFKYVFKQTLASDCVVGPLAVNNKIIGIFYADRQEEALSNNDVEAFELFVLQVRMCLQSLGK